MAQTWSALAVFRNLLTGGNLHVRWWVESKEVLEKLKRSVDRRVRLAFLDGEILTADLSLVLEDEDAIIFDLVATNRPDKYEKSDKPPCIFAKIPDIVRCEPLDDRAGGAKEAY